MRYALSVRPSGHIALYVIFSSCYLYLEG